MPKQAGPMRSRQADMRAVSQGVRAMQIRGVLWVTRAEKGPAKDLANGEGRRLSGRKLDEWAGCVTTSATPTIDATGGTSNGAAGPSVQPTTAAPPHKSELKFVNISQPLEANRAENRAMVRSHAMRNFKRQQGRQQSPKAVAAAVAATTTTTVGEALAGHVLHVGARLALRTTRSSLACICARTPRSRGSGGPGMDAAAARGNPLASPLLEGDRCARAGLDAVQQLLMAGQKTAATPSTAKFFCDDCGGLLSGDFRERARLQTVGDQQPHLRVSVFDPFDTLRTAPFRVEVQELVHHAVGTMWPSLYPLGSFDPMDEVLGPLVISDELLFQSNLLNAACHLSALQGKKYSAEGTRCRIETIRILNERLGDPQAAVTDATIVAVTGLLAQAIVNRNIPEIQVHADGLHKMVKLAGGLEKLGLDGLLQELVYWTELCSAAVANTEPRFTHPSTHQRLTILPIFTAPRCPMSKMGRGLREMFAPSRHEFTRRFEDLLELLNQVRCLGWVLHISHSCGRPRIVLGSFRDRGTLMRRCILELPDPFGADGGVGAGAGAGLSGEGGGHLFECLRFATLMFLEFVLSGPPPPLLPPPPSPQLPKPQPKSPSTSPCPPSSTLATLSSQLLKCVQKLNSHAMQPEYASFFFWVFAMGGISAGATDPATRTYFVDLTDRAGRHAGVRTWAEARVAWIAFLAVEVTLDGPLRGLWVDVESRRARGLVSPRRLRNSRSVAEGNGVSKGNGQAV